MLQKGFEKCYKKVVYRKVLPKGHRIKMLLRGRVIYGKKFCEKDCFRNFLVIEKDNNRCFIKQKQWCRKNHWPISCSESSL